MGRTDPISKMKQEEKEFHKEVMVSLHLETYIYIYIYNLRNHKQVRGEERSLQGVQAINNLQSNLQASTVTTYKAVVGNGVYICREG